MSQVPLLSWVPLVSWVPLLSLLPLESFLPLVSQVPVSVAALVLGAAGVSVSALAPYADFAMSVPGAAGIFRCRPVLGPLVSWELILSWCHWCLGCHSKLCLCVCGSYLRCCSCVGAAGVSKAASCHGYHSNGVSWVWRVSLVPLLT